LLAARRVSSNRGYRIQRGAGFAARSLVMLASLVAWDTSSPQVASAGTEAPPVECGEDSADVRGLAKPRRYQPCKPRQPLPANPGRCSDRAHRLLYAQVDKYCHAPRGCSPQADACEIIDKKIRYGYGCTDAREVLQGQCFRPGDARYHDHMDELEKAYKSLRKCIAIQEKKCPR
jgi:hypothetical protein